MQLSENKLHLSAVHGNLKKKHFQDFFYKHFLCTHMHTNSYTKYQHGYKVKVVLNCKELFFSVGVQKFICASHKRRKYSRDRLVLWLQPNLIKMILQKTNEGPLPKLLIVACVFIPCPKPVKYFRILIFLFNLVHSNRS